MTLARDVARLEVVGNIGFGEVVMVLVTATLLFFAGPIAEVGRDIAEWLRR